MDQLKLTLAVHLITTSVAVEEMIAIAASLIPAGAATIIVPAITIVSMVAMGTAVGGHGIERVVSGVLD
jgi:hypothetical protein